MVSNLVEVSGTATMSKLPMMAVQSIQLVIWRFNGSVPILWLNAQAEALSLEHQTPALS